MNDLFFITDGDTFINLRSKSAGVFLQSWQPGIKEPKNGGIWQDSPLADGRVLVDRPFGNGIEQLNLIIGSGGQEATIYDTQELRRLLQKAVNYSLSDWQTEPVWIFARARDESNIRYAIIYDYRAPGQGNPFADPFDGDFPIVPFPLMLERSDWFDYAPGEAGCLPGSTLLEIGQEASYSPSADSDDAYINGIFIFDTEEIRAGNQLSLSLRSGIRFQNVAIPQGATILSAVLRLTVSNLATGTVCNIKIRAEDADTAAAFSTLVDFTGRAETSAGVNWNNLSGSWTIGEQISTPDISSVIKEVIDRAGWASGNDLVLFLDDNGSDIDAYRRFASYQSKDWAVPVLEIAFSDGNVIGETGQEATCEDANFIGNRRSGVLTHVWHYDDNLTTYSSNLLAATLPYGLLPASPAVNDLLIFMSEAGNPLSGPIASIVADLSTAMSGISGQWLYYDGATWQNLAISNTPDFGAQPFQSTGINSVHFRQPADMSTVLMNTITGWAVIFKVTSVSSPVRPVQQNRNLYTISLNEILIPEDGIGGDLPPYLNLTLTNRGDNTGALNPAPIAVNRVIVGLRSVLRGDLFTSIINCGDKYNPSGITNSAGANTSFGADSQAPTGRAAIYNPAGAASIATRLTISFSSALSQHYKGKFKPFLRVKQAGGVAGDMGARLRIGLYSLNNVIYTSDTLYTSITDEIELFEFREVALPPNIDIIKPTEAIAGITISVDALNTNATPPDLHLIDLFLIPVDEYSLDTFDPYISVDSIFGNPSANRVLELDSAFRLKRQASSMLLLEQGPTPLLNWALNSNGPLILQPAGDQKLHFLFARVNANNGWDSYPENAVSLRMYILKRYFSMRGNR